MARTEKISAECKGREDETALMETAYREILVTLKLLGKVMYRFVPTSNGSSNFLLWNYGSYVFISENVFCEIKALGRFPILAQVKSLQELKERVGDRVLVRFDD